MIIETATTLGYQRHRAMPTPECHTDIVTHHSVTETYLRDMVTYRSVMKTLHYIIKITYPRNQIRHISVCTSSLLLYSNVVFAVYLVNSGDMFGHQLVQYQNITENKPSF